MRLVRQPEAAHPGVKVRVIGTGPATPGREKLTAQQESAQVGYRR